MAKRDERNQGSNRWKETRKKERKKERKREIEQTKENIQGKNLEGSERDRDKEKR